MAKKLTSYEKNLVELVHFISYKKGLNLKDTYNFLQHPIESKNGKSALDCIRENGRNFLNELRLYMNEMGDN